MMKSLNFSIGVVVPNNGAIIEMYLKNMVAERPNIYRCAHKSHQFMSNNFIKIGTLIGMVTSAASIVLNKILYNEFKLSSFTAVFFMMFICTITFILWLVIQYAMNVSGVPERFVFVGEYFSAPKKSIPCELFPEKIECSRFEFVNEETIELVSYMNACAFKNGNWKDGFNKKYQRNLSHIRKNEFSMMLIHSKSENKKIGFTHIFPVDQITWQNYLDGKIGDNGYDAENICSTILSKKKHEKPYGIIVFSIAHVFRDEELKKSQNRARHIGDILEQAAIFHGAQHLRTTFSKYETVPILFQNMGIDLYKFFKPFAKSTTNLSKDGDRIITFEVYNPYFKSRHTKKI